MSNYTSVRQDGVSEISRKRDRINSESLILAQSERWRRGLGMQVEREIRASGMSIAANG